MRARRFRVIAVAGWRTKVQCTPRSNLAKSRCGCVRTCHVSSCDGRSAVESGKRGKGKEGGIRGTKAEGGINDRDSEAEDDGLRRRTESERNGESESAAKSRGR